jgi:hypothetical protein
MTAEEHARIWAKTSTELTKIASEHAGVAGPYHAAFSAVAVLASKMALGYFEAAKTETKRETDQS